MNYLLDTHAILWALFEPERLGTDGREIIQDPRNHVYVSAVSLWEISLKYSIGKLELSGVTPEQLPDAIDQMRIAVLELTAEESSSFHTLPRDLHKDPFDRMLVWQAIRRRLCLVSRAAALEVFQPYGLKLQW